MVRKITAIVAFVALTIVLLPVAHAQDWRDNDVLAFGALSVMLLPISHARDRRHTDDALQEQHETLHPDKRELKQDLREGSMSAARDELGENASAP